jgi:hypothetical protein
MRVWQWVGEFGSPVGSLSEYHHTGRIGICGVRYGETHSGTRAAKSPRRMEQRTLLKELSKMNVMYGLGKTKYGPGVNIELTGEEVAMSISAYLVAHNIHIDGSRTITVNGSLCEVGHVYVDPSGFVIADGERFLGRGPTSDL